MASQKAAGCNRPRSRAPHLSLGAEGETRAARYFRRRGYRIVGRNVRAGGVELDLIVRRGGLVVFVEVKTRRCLLFGAPELAVNAAKRARLAAGASAWLYQHGSGVTIARFDVIAWRVSDGRAKRSRWELRHIEGAFDATD